MQEKATINEQCAAKVRLFLIIVFTRYLVYCAVASARYIHNKHVRANTFDAVTPIRL